MTVVPLTSNTIHLRDFHGAWGDLPTYELPSKCAVLANSQYEAACAVKSHLIDGGEVLLAPLARADQSQREDLRSEGFSLVTGLGTKLARVHPPSGEGSYRDGRLWLLTSGTSGRPKMVAHTLGSLLTVHSPQPARKWLCPYAPGSYAWWQIVTLSIFHAGVAIVFIDEDGLDSWPDVAIRESVDSVSGTPTFWRHALWRNSSALRELRLSQVTLGGEPVDQVLLDNLRRALPQARVSWIYASSEAGASIAVHDGMAGFPASWLNRIQAGRPRLSVVDDELVIRSGRAAEDQPEEQRTGDRVEVRDGRVFIVGRLGSDEVNVGGTKISASRVRETILRHPSVRWAAVRGRSAPIVGQVVVADVVTDGTLGVAELKSWCSRRLPEHGVPRRINLLGQIPMKGSLKSDV